MIFVIIGILGVDSELANVEVLILLDTAFRMVELNYAYRNAI
jgi:hypothetical protein